MIFTFKRSIFILLALTVVIIINMKNTVLTNAIPNRYFVFSIIFEYRGYSCEQIEQLITIPLEHKLSSVDGLNEIYSTTENSKSTVTLYFNKNTDKQRLYSKISEICDEMYYQLPSDVQKPRILSSSVQDKTVFIFTLQTSRNWILDHLKNELMSILGICDVQVYGGSQKYIHIKADQNQITGRNISWQYISSQYQNYDIPNLSLQFETNDNDNRLLLNTSPAFNELQKIPVNSESDHCDLSNLAQIYYQNDADEEITKINGTECICIEVKSNSDLSCFHICKKIKKILSDLPKEYNCVIISDSGEEQWKLLSKLIFSLILAVSLNSIVLYLFTKSLKLNFILLFFLLYDIGLTLCLLHIFNIPFTQNTVTGINISLGLITDNALLVVFSKARTNLNNSAMPLIKVFIEALESTSTTLIALVPIFFIENYIPGIRSIILPIFIAILVSLILSFTLLLSFIEELKIVKSTRTSDFLKSRIIDISNKKIDPRIFLILCVLPFPLFMISGKSINLENSNNLIYITCEYPNEQTAKFIDSDISPFIQKINENQNIKLIQSTALRGQALIKIVYTKDKQSVLEYLDKYKNLIGCGKVYIPNLHSPKTQTFSLKITASGKDWKICQEMAKQAANQLMAQKLSSQVVLNFKENENLYSYIPHDIYLYKTGLTPLQIGQTLKYMFFNPVISKKIISNRQYDVRLSNGVSKPDIKSIKQTILTGNTKLIDSGKLQKDLYPSKLYHTNLKRSCQITAEIPETNLTKTISKIQNELFKIQNQQNKFCDQNYTFSLSKEAINIHQNILNLIFSLILSLLLIFCITTAVNESIKAGVLLLLTIPASLTLPLLIRFITCTSLESGDIIGMVLTSGTCINNSIYVYENFNIKYKRLSENILDCILITSITTILGAFPLMFIKSDNFSSSLSFFLFWGTISSVFVSTVLFPVLLEKTRKFIYK